MDKRLIRVVYHKAWNSSRLLKLNKLPKYLNFRFLLPFFPRIAPFSFLLYYFFFPVVFLYFYLFISYLEGLLINFWRWIWNFIHPSNNNILRLASRWCLPPPPPSYDPASIPCMRNLQSILGFKRNCKSWEWLDFNWYLTCERTLRIFWVKTTTDWTAPWSGTSSGTRTLSTNQSCTDLQTC